MAAEQVALQEIADMMKKWEEESSVAGYDPVPVLERMAEVLEAEIEVFNKIHPDPFDKRYPPHDPDLVDPNSVLGQVLKVIFKNGNFMDKLVNDYLCDNFWTRSGFPERDATDLNIAASRLVMPGLEAHAVFQKSPRADSLIIRLFNWAEKAQDPLKTYAVGLLAVAMEIRDVTLELFLEENTKLVPLMLARLRDLQNEMIAQRMFANLAINRIKEHDDKPEGDLVNTSGGIGVSERSYSSRAEMESCVIANSSIYPLTLAAKQFLILRYLTPINKYFNFVSYMFEYNALSLIIEYINIKETRETRLGFEALKCLHSLLCGKKAIEFINMGGLQRLLAVPPSSIAATGVSKCLRCLTFLSCEEAMGKICTGPKQLITELVTYALWLMECSIFNSGRYNAIIFLDSSFSYRIFLDEFDAQDGLRKLYNATSMPLTFFSDDEVDDDDDEDDGECDEMVYLVIVALERYFKAHLSIKVEYYMRLRQGTAQRDLPIPYRPFWKTDKEVQEQIETLLSMMPFNARWVCVDQFQRLGGIHFLLKIICNSKYWRAYRRDFTVCSILTILAICCSKPKVQLAFCERLVLRNNCYIVGMKIILECCEGEIVPDAQVQKAALYVIINCVCAPTDRDVVTPTSIAKRRRFKSYEEILQKIWGSVRENNGIMVLQKLMLVKTSIAHADALRALACRALSGLTRCEEVRQIVCKLPAQMNESMEVALKGPILNEKRQEHVLLFQKYRLALIDLITATIEMTKFISNIACNAHDSQIAVIENQPLQNSVRDTAIQLYSVGRRRDTEDEVEEEEEEDVSDDGSNSGSNSDDNLDRNDLLNIGDVFSQQSDNEG